MKTRRLRHGFGQLADREVDAGADIEKRQGLASLILRGLRSCRVPVLKGEDAGLTQIIHMQKLPQR